MPLLEAVEHAALASGRPGRCAHREREDAHACAEALVGGRAIRPDRGSGTGPRLPRLHREAARLAADECSGRDRGVEARCVNYGSPHEEARRAPRRCARERGRRRVGDGCDRGRQALGPGAQPRRPLHLCGPAGRGRLGARARHRRVDREHARVQLVLPAADAHVPAPRRRELGGARRVSRDGGCRQRARRPGAAARRARGAAGTRVCCPCGRGARGGGAPAQRHAEDGAAPRRVARSAFSADGDPRGGIGARQSRRPARAVRP